jgi:hypothetical protein
MSRCGDDVSEIGICDAGKQPDGVEYSINVDRILLYDLSPSKCFDIADYQS